MFTISIATKKAKEKNRHLGDRLVM